MDNRAQREAQEQKYADQFNLHIDIPIRPPTPALTPTSPEFDISPLLLDDDDHELSGLVELFESSEDKKLKELQEELSEDEGNWLPSLRALVTMEVDTILDDSNPKAEQEKKAFIAFMAGNLEHFIDENDTDKESIATDFVSLQDLLTVQTASPIYRSLIERDVKEDQYLPSVETIKLATLNILEGICKEKNIPTAISKEMQQQIIFNDAPFFISEKKYTYEEMLALFSKIVMPFEISMHQLLHYNILIHALLQFVGVTEFPSYCLTDSVNVIDTMGSYYHKQTIFSPGHFYIHLNISQAGFQKFIRDYNKDYDKNAIERITARYDGNYSAIVKINTVVKILLSANFREWVEAFLANEEVLENYKLICNQSFIRHSAIVESAKRMGKKYDVTPSRCDFFEAALIQAFGVRAELQAGQFGEAKRYDSFATCTDFHLGIPTQDAMDMVTEINNQFPGAAKFIQANVRLQSKGDIDLQLISIKNTVLRKKEFLARIEAALDYIAKEKIDLLEAFQVSSGSRKFTTKQLSEKLATLAHEYKNNSDRLFNSLSTLSLFASQRKSKNELDEASFEVEKAVAAHQDTFATRAEYNLFKEKKKQAIKEVQRELFTRGNLPGL